MNDTTKPLMLKLLRRNLTSSLEAASRVLRDAHNNLRMPFTEDPDPQFIVDGEFHERLIELAKYVDELVELVGTLPPDKTYGSNE